MNNDARGGTSHLLTEETVASRSEGGTMRYGRIFLSVGLCLLVVAPVLAQMDSTADLKAAFEAEISAVNARDLETLMEMQHAHVVSLSAASPSPIDGKAARRHSYQQLFETMEVFTVTPQNPQYRVVGDTGVVWGRYTIARKPKGGSTTTSSVRFSRTYIKVDGKWQLLVYHTSPVPTDH